MRFKTQCTIIIVCVALAVTAAISVPVGQTSRWGVVVAPCVWCGAINDIEVHHIYPQHRWPELAHDTNNMVCLCRRCHFTVGHKNNFKRCVTNLLNVIKEGNK